MALLIHRFGREQDKARGIYDVAWGILAFKDMGRHYEQLYDEARQAVSSLERRMRSEDLSGFLFDYRRAVGVALSIYLIGAEGLGLTKERLNEICEALTVYSERSEIGELIGATFLLSRHLKHEEMEKRARSLMLKVRELAFKDPTYHLIDLMYVTFFSAIAGDRFYMETLEMIRGNEYLQAYIKDDPEKLALFLYMVSKASSTGDSPLAKWCKEVREKVAPSLRHFIEENCLTLGDHLSLAEALISAAVGCKAYIQQNYPFVKEVRDNEVVISLRAVDSLLPRPDLVSKAIIALCEAGYLTPFMLSKREADAYRQIRAELKGYRRVRKYEMVFILTSFALFMLLLPSIIYGLTTARLDVVQTISSYYLYYVPYGSFIVFLVTSVWRKGHVSRQDLMEMFKKTLPWLKNKK
jgi:hypothetical protein